MSWQPSNDPILGDPKTCDALELVIVRRADRVLSAPVEHLIECFRRAALSVAADAAPRRGGSPRR